MEKVKGKRGTEFKTFSLFLFTFHYKYLLRLH
jgi:hypothetical protein